MIFWRFLKEIYKKSAGKMLETIEIFLKDDKRILDLGCGSGIFGETLRKKKNIELIGIDIKDERVEKIPFQKFDGKKIPFPDNSFDAILIAFVLHHCEVPKETLKEARRVGKKIIIFEDLPDGSLGKIRCHLHQFFWDMLSGKRNGKFNFFSEEKWEEIFKELELKIIAKKDFSPDFKILDPVKRKIFVLEK